MLVLSRKLNEKIHLGDNITLTVLRIQGNAIRLGIDAPRDVRILRGELEPQDNNRTTKDLLFTVISEDSAGDGNAATASGSEPAFQDSPSEGDSVDRDSVDRDAESATVARPTYGKASPARPLSSFVSAAHKPNEILHQTL